MAKRKSKSRQFRGMGYREAQRSNSTRRKQLSKTEQSWLKENGCKNVGWDHVIQLYHKIDELLYQPNQDEPTLEELFLEADRIGQKYQTHEEIETFHKQMAAEVNAISDKVDQQFPETEFEVIDYSQKTSSRLNSKRNSKKYH